MLYGLSSVVDQSTSSSTLVDPFVSQLQQEQATADLAAQTQLQAQLPKQQTTGWPILGLVLTAVAFFYFKRGRQ